MVRNTGNKKNKEKREEIKEKVDGSSSDFDDLAELTDPLITKSDSEGKIHRKKGKVKGKKSKINPSPASRKSPRKKGKLNYQKLHSGKDQRLVVENEEGKNLPGTVNKCQKVQFEEDGNLVEIEAEGMDTEFLSDEEEGLLEDSEGVDSEEEVTEYETVVEIPEQSEVTEVSMNNNVTMPNRRAEAAATGIEKTMKAKESKEQKAGSAKKRKSSSVAREEDLEQEDRIVNKTMARLQAIMTQGRYIMGQNKTSTVVEAKRGKGDENLNLSNSPSESMIYKVAVQPAVMASSEKRSAEFNKRKSSSSEEGEELENENPENLLVNSNFIENFISECRVANVADHNREMPSTSGYQQN